MQFIELHKQNTKTRVFKVKQTSIQIGTLSSKAVDCLRAEIASKSANSLSVFGSEPASIHNAILTAPKTEVETQTSKLRQTPVRLQAPVGQLNPTFDNTVNKRASVALAKLTNSNLINYIITFS